MKSKITKESRNLLISLLLGDGTISNNNVFKICHGENQKDYLEWKIKQLNEAGIRNNGLKCYTVNSGYKVGKTAYYTQLNTISFVKVLRRVVYNSGSKSFSRKLLNRIGTKGLAIWYIDDGHINFRKTNGRVCGFYIKISICKSKDYTQSIIDFLKEEFNINFYMFHEGRKNDSYSICCGTREGIKFIELIKPYVLQIPSMKYKITYNLDRRQDL